MPIAVHGIIFILQKTTPFTRLSRLPWSRLLAVTSTLDFSFQMRVCLSFTKRINTQRVMLEKTIFTLRKKPNHKNEKNNTLELSST
jgi:hypothetical protein